MSLAVQGLQQAFLRHREERICLGVASLGSSQAVDVVVEMDVCLVGKNGKITMQQPVK